MICDPHPEKPNVLCDNSMINHAECSGWDQGTGFIDWPNPNYTPPKKTTKKAARSRMSEMAGSVAPATRVEPSEGFQAGLEGSERAATKWDDEQKALVDAAIQRVAMNHSGGKEFTSDHIWDELKGAVPVTKGLTARLAMAQRRGIIGNTEKTVISRRGGHHDHGQRLTLWYSLL